MDAANSYALEAIVYPEALEAVPPPRYEPGSPAEADVLSELQWRAWHRRPDALAWVRAYLDPDDDPAVDGTPSWELIVESDEEPLRESLLAFLDPTDERVLQRLLAYGDEGPGDENWCSSQNALHPLDGLGLSARAVQQLVAFVERLARFEHVMESAAVRCLASVGEAAVVPLLSAHAAAGDEDERHGLLCALVATTVQSEQIYQRLVSFLQEDLIRGAVLLQDYGDSRAITLLSERLDAADPDPEGASRSDAIELVEAILGLGGVLTEAQSERFAFFVERRAQLMTPEGRRELAQLLRQAMGSGRAEEQDEDQPAPPLPYGGFDADVGDRSPLSPGEYDDGPLMREDRPGRNEPCWCGSGAKYKRCHLTEDESPY